MHKIDLFETKLCNATWLNLKPVKSQFSKTKFLTA